LAAYWRLPPRPGHKLPGTSPASFAATLAACCQGVSDDFRGCSDRASNGHHRRDGKYLIETLSRGRYSVTAALRGVEPWSIDLDVDGGSMTMDVVLRAPPFSERVTVSATKTGAADIQSTPVSITANGQELGQRELAFES
jgi:hypothetical protein